MCVGGGTGAGDAQHTPDLPGLHQDLCCARDVLQHGRLTAVLPAEEHGKLPRRCESTSEGFKHLHSTPHLPRSVLALLEEVKQLLLD